MTDATYRSITREQGEALAEALILAEVTARRMTSPAIDPAFDHEDELGEAYLAAIRACRSWRADGGSSRRTWVITQARWAIQEFRRQQDFLSRSDRDAEQARLAALAAAEDPDEQRRLARAQDPRFLTPVSLDEVIDAQEDPERPGIDSPPVVSDDLETVRARVDLAAPLAALPAKWRTVLQLVFWRRMEYREVGIRIGLSESRVQQIITQSCERLRDSLPGYDEGTAAPVRDYTAWWALPDEELLRQREAGESPQQIAAQFGIRRDTVRERLRRLGARAKKAGQDGRPPRPTDDELEALALSGMSRFELARRFGLHPGTIANRLTAIRKARRAA